MLIRSLWKVLDINEQQQPKEDSVILRRTRGGLLTSDTVTSRYFNRRDRYLVDAVAYIDSVVINDLDVAQNPDILTGLLGNNYQEIVTDDQLTDRENSKTISDALNLTNNGQPVYIQNHQIRPDMRANVLPNNLIINYTVWCILHNKLMIEPNNIFGRYIYSCNINEPPSNDRDFFIMYPDYVAEDWSRKWSITVSRNNTLEIIKSFNKYKAAQRAANKYLKKITGDRRIPVHNFRIGEFTLNTEIGDQIVVKAYKEKELI